CVALAMLSIRLRWLGRQMRKLAAHNEALADRNWELKEAEERVRALFESQGDFVVIRNTAREITFANEAYCALAGKPSSELSGARFELAALETGASATSADGTRLHDQRVMSTTGPRWIAWRENWVRVDAGRP